MRATPPAAELYAENLALRGQLGELRAAVVHLRAQIAWLKKKLFGPGQSETLERAQLLPALGALEKLATGLIAWALTAKHCDFIVRKKCSPARARRSRTKF